MPNRRSGLLFVKIDGEQYDAKGDFTYNLGQPKRDAIVGPDQVHGYKELPKVAFIEGAITDVGTLNVANLQNFDDATVTLQLANGKTIVLQEAWYCADGDVTTEEAEIQIRFEGKRAEELPA